MVVATGLLASVVRFAAESPDRVDLGPRVFKVGRADRLAPRIAQDGPLLFQDTLDRGREIYVQHTGAGEDEGWMAFEAYGPDAPHQPDCVLTWDGAARRFRDPCGDGSYPPDGAGLAHYQTTVEDGLVVVDLNSRVTASVADDQVVELDRFAWTVARRILSVPVRGKLSTKWTSSGTL